jgi:hypothetical protein
MRESRPARAGALIAVLLLAVVRQTDAADLDARTLEAYERYVASVEAAFVGQLDGDAFLATDTTSMRGGSDRRSTVVRPGAGDGILDMPGGLVHHWRGAAFIAGVTLENVLAVTQGFDAYTDVYPWVLGTRVFDQPDHAPGDRYRVLLRMKGSAGGVESTLDLWTSVEYRYPRPGRAAAMTEADCVRQVKNAGEPDEQLLPPGTGSGHLWRAHTFARYLEQDGGVYVELENLGLSRDYPPLLGWAIEPFARRLGRGSVERSLIHLRAALRTSTSLDVTGTAGRGSADRRLPTFWCTP